MKKILTLIGIVPVLALFGGIGILAYRISETWEAATTQALVTGLTVVCGGGTLVLCILLALIVGVPLAIRAYGEGGIRHRDWSSAGHSRLVDWNELPTRLAMRRPPAMVDGQWQQLPALTPPWGATVGGHSQLLPPPQDDRFGIDNNPS